MMDVAEIALRCVEMVMENGSQAVISDPIPHAERIFEWVMDKVAQTPGAHQIENPGQSPTSGTRRGRPRKS